MVGPDAASAGTGHHHRDGPVRMMSSPLCADVRVVIKRLLYGRR